MEKTEAIERLEYLKARAQIALEQEVPDWIAEDVLGTIEAYDMAIEALQTEPSNSEIPNNCTNCECTDDCSECKEAEHGCKTEPQYDFGEYADRLWKIAYERGKREALEQTEPQKKEVEWVYNKRERLWYPYSNGELLFKTEPNCSEKPNNCEDKPQKDCNGCKFVGTYDTEFPCANCSRKTKDYYAKDGQTDCPWK